MLDRLVPASILYIQIIYIFSNTRAHKRTIIQLKCTAADNTCIVHCIEILVVVGVIECTQLGYLGETSVIVRVQKVGFREILQSKIQLLVLLNDKGDANVFHVIRFEQPHDRTLETRVRYTVEKKDLARIWKVWLVFEYKVQVGQSLALFVARRKIVADNAIENQLRALRCKRRR